MHPRHHIAHHKNIGVKGQLVGTVALYQINPQTTQLVAHGRINAGVATRHLVPRLNRQSSQAAHEGAANSEYVYVHRLILEVNRRIWPLT